MGWGDINGTRLVDREGVWCVVAVFIDVLARFKKIYLKRLTQNTPPVVW